MHKDDAGCEYVLKDVLETCTRAHGALDERTHDCMNTLGYQKLEKLEVAGGSRSAAAKVSGGEARSDGPQAPEHTFPA